jgi:hypothetical protein
MEKERIPSRKGAVLLLVAASASLAIALLHVVMVVVGPRAYRYFGAGETLVRQAEAGSWIPPFLAFVVAALFVACAAYALAGAGRIRSLPWTRVVLLIIAAVLLFRGISALPQAWVMVTRPGLIPTRYFVSSLVSLLAGVCYALGIGLLWKDVGVRRGTAG